MCISLIHQRVVGDFVKIFFIEMNTDVRCLLIFINNIQYG